MPEQVPAKTLALSALWYTYGYNDHRSAHAIYVDPEQFMRYFLALDAEGSRPSIQDAFKAFREEVEHQARMRQPLTLDQVIDQATEAGLID